MKDSDAIYASCPVAKGTGAFMLKLSKSYSPLLDSLGFTAITDPATAKLRLVRVGDALNSGDIIKVRISLKGTATQPSGSTKVVCATKDLVKALEGLPQKSFGNKVISGVGSPKNVRYR